jgi:thymidylate kinase
MWHACQAKALGTYFNALNDAGVPWLVLRNYVGLPESNTAKDVDLVVPKANVPRAIEVLFAAMRQNGFSLYEHQRFECIWCFTFYTNNSATPESIKIDLLYGFVWRGAVIIDATEMLSTGAAYKGLPILSPSLDGFLLWLKPLMTGGFVKQKYKPEILHAIAAHPNEFQALLADKFGAGLSAKVWPLLAAGEVEATAQIKGKLRAAAWTRLLRKKPTATLISTTAHFALELYRRRVRPRGSFVAVVGPDGVGKTTFIELLKYEIARLMVKDSDSVVVKHFRPNVFPNIRKLLAHRSYDPSKEAFHEPHRAQPVGALSSIARLAYYWLDYIFGYVVEIRSACIAGQVFIFDRYFYDFVVDPRRSRICLPSWLRKAFLLMTPQPDLVFFLDCDAETVFARKQELTLKEIERQLGEYRKLAAALPQRFVRIDARQPAEVSCQQALTQVVERCFLRVEAEP